MAIFNKVFFLILSLAIFYTLIFPMLVSMDSDLAVGLGFAGIIANIYFFGRVLVKQIQKELE